MRHHSLAYTDVLARDLRVMDQAVIVLARDHGLPLHVFDFDEHGAISGDLSRREPRHVHLPQTKLVTSPAAAA